MSDNYQHYLWAKSNHDTAEHILVDALKKAFPKGERITFVKIDTEYEGVVLDHGFGHERLKIRNVDTGKEYWAYVSTVDPRPWSRN